MRPVRYNVAAILQQKVTLQADPNRDPVRGELAFYVLDQVIQDVESEIDIQLSPRYETPFAVDHAAFLAIVPTSTQHMIRRMVDVEAAARLLRRVHGAAGPVRGDDYLDPLHDEWTEGIARLLDRDTAPLAGVVLRHSEQDNARAAAVVLDNGGWDTGYGPTGPIHPVNWAKARLPRSDL